MKKKLFLKFFVLAVIGAFVTFTSCKDYDDDINNLQAQIDKVSATLAELKAKVDAGAVITDVTSTTDGVVIKLSNGKSYTITNGKDGVDGTDGKDGVNGTNGTNGKDGSVVEVGANGNWFIDGKDTGLAAQGKDGAQGPAGEKGETGAQGPAGETGAQGPAGETGAQGPAGEKGETGAQGPAGADGKYYYPGENGFWVEVDGETETETDKTWLPEGTITAVWENGSVILYNVEGTEGPVVIGVVAVNTLTLIPDFVADKGGALPIIDFSPLVTECGDIAPSVTVRYKVNKNASESSINKNAIYFLHNTPTVRAGEGTLNPKAEFVNLENGILSVKVDVNTAALLAESTGKIDQLMLVVPLVNGDEVHSDWAKVTAEPVDAIALAKKEVYEDDDVVFELIAKTLQDAMDNDPIIDIAYDETIDLLDWVTTVLEDAGVEFDINRYGLEYAFDLKGLDGETIVYELGGNNTDQQKFINLVGSEVSTRVYNLEGANPASVNRTPIVHVYLKSKDGSLECNVADGFIKLNIVEAKVEDVPPVIFDAGEIEAGCDVFSYIVGTQEMNEQFYAKAKVSKDFFHKNYEWTPTPNGEGAGVIAEKPDEEETESYNLEWRIGKSHQIANIGNEVTKSGSYVYGNNEIKVTFKATIVQPTVDLSGLLLDNYWFSNNTYIKHNVATPDLDATDPLLATYENNISAAFKTTADKLLDLEFANEDYVGYSYEYVFDIADQPIKSVDGITISVSADGKRLLAAEGTGTPEVVATILAQDAGTGDILEYNETSELGKYLLNKGPEFMKARVKLLVSNECGQPVVVNAFGGKDSFLVHFLRPVNVEGQSAENFTDGVDFGADGSILDLRDVVQLSDWRNYVGNVTTYYFDPNHENYYKYYDVQSYTVDLTEITPVGLTVGGVALTELPSTIVIDQVAPSTDYPYGTLTYRNNGANLATQFTLKVPVTVTYKWGELVTVVDVLVKPTTEVRSAR